jgi:hypothetical protein
MCLRVTGYEMRRWMEKWHKIVINGGFWYYRYIIRHPITDKQPLYIYCNEFAERLSRQLLCKHGDYATIKKKVFSVP